MLLPGETVDDLMRDGLRIIQSKTLPKFGVEGVLLANFPTVKDGARICDLCTGSGIIPLLLTTRAKNLDITGVEISSSLCSIAKRSVMLNKLGSIIEIVEADLRKLDLPLESFDLITANPPYFKKVEGRVSTESARALARTQIETDVIDVLNTAYGLLKTKGFMALSYKTSGLNELLTQLTRVGFNAVRLRFVHHSVRNKASSFLLLAQKAGGAQLMVEPPLIMYNPDGDMTLELKELYFAGKPLESGV